MITLKKKYFKNFILCGELVYRCLICTENYSSINEVENHLRSKRHKMKLKSHTCLPQFIKDAIFKVDSYYYCQRCNKVEPDIPKIKQHIDSDAHKNYKSRPEDALKRVEVTMDNNCITINPKGTKTQVTHLQWNGIIDKYCVVCNFIAMPCRVAHHMSSPDHAVKLMQTRILCEGGKYYRKTDADTFQCFGCNKTIPMGMFHVHISNHINNNATEISNTLNCSLNIKNENKDTDKEKRPLNDCIPEQNREHPTVVSSMEKINDTEWAIEVFEGIEDDYFEIDKNARALICKDCKTVVRTSAHEISSHLFTHHTYHVIYSNFRLAIQKYIDQNYVIENFDHGAARSKVAEYANRNYIKLNDKGSEGYCRLCDKCMSASIKMLETHVAGGYHKGHLELKAIRKPEKHIRGSYKPDHILQWINTLAYSADMQAFLINDTLLIAEDSFFLMKRIIHGKYYKKTKCFACDETILPEDEKEHCISWKHKSNLLAAKCVSEKELYIREIRPRLYHCGLCNTTLPYWECLIRHCKQYNHESNIAKTVSPLVKKFGFSRKIVLKTNKDNIYMQFMNAVFNTKFVIKLDIDQPL